MIAWHPLSLPLAACCPLAESLCGGTHGASSAQISAGILSTAEGMIIQTKTGIIEEGNEWRAGCETMEDRRRRWTSVFLVLILRESMG